MENYGRLLVKTLKAASSILSKLEWILFLHRRDYFVLTVQLLKYSTYVITFSEIDTTLELIMCFKSIFITIRSYLHFKIELSFNEICKTSSLWFAAEASWEFYKILMKMFGNFEKLVTRVI